MQHVTSQDGTLIAVERSGTGPPVVIVNGALSTRAWGQAMADEWGYRYTVHRYDRRGRGESTDTSRYAPAREIEDLAAVIDMAGDASFVYGHSSGANLALRAAEAGLPIRRLALFEPPFVGSDPDAVPHVAHHLDNRDRAGAIRYFLLSIGLTSTAVDAIIEPAMEDLAYTLVYDLTLTGDNDGLVPTDRLSRITVPTMVLNSTGSHQSLRDAAAATAAALPNGVHREVAGSRHGAPGTDLADLIGRFFTN